MINSVFSLIMLATLSGTGSESKNDLNVSIERVLLCAKNKDIYCLSRNAKNLHQIYVRDTNGKLIVHPYLEDDAFSDKTSISLFIISSNRKLYARKAFKVNSDHYEVVFYRVGIILADSKYSEFTWRSDVLQCGFVKTSKGWRLTDSFCGYLDD